MSKNFSATRVGIAIGVTTGSLPTQLGTDLNLASNASDALLDNRGGADCYVCFGAADVSVAVATGLRVPAGSIGLYGKGNATHVAVIGDAVTSLVIHLGEGG